MKLIREYQTGRLITKVYSHPPIRNAASATQFIAGAAAQEFFHAGYIALRDPEHGPDEDNNSRQLLPAAAADEILEAFAAAPCTRLYLSGKYQRANAGIGIDMRSFEVSVTMSAGQQERAEKLAALLAELPE